MSDYKHVTAQTEGGHLMKTRMQIHNPDTVELSLNITMTVGDWRRFSQQLAENAHRTTYPLWKVREHIHDAVKQLAETVEQEAEME